MPESLGTATPARARAWTIARRTAAAALCGIALSACKTLSPDGGMDTVAGVTGEAINKDVIAIRTPEDASAAHARVAQLLRRPLTVDTAVQVALLNNRGLQAAYNELGIAETVM